MKRSTATRRDTPVALLTEVSLPTRPDAVPDDIIGRFLAGVVDALGEIAPFSVLDITDANEPRISLYTSTGRKYGVCVTNSGGPVEVWTYAEVPAGKAARWAELREREEMLTQSLGTTRLAWHADAVAGWIGQPAAVAADLTELDDELALSTATALERMFFGIERICGVLDERDSLRDEQDARV